jgi:catechol 2,3-dioxygenase-like lactoylglutathione lyase family enzyme
MRILGIEHVQLAMPAGGEDRARQFYSGVLGIPEVPKPVHLAKRGGAWFEAGRLKIHLGVDGDFRPARKAHPALLVEGLRQLVEALQAGEYPVVDDEPLDGYTRVYVTDPFGNRIELMEADEEKMKKSGLTKNQSASELVAKRITELADWRGQTLSMMRTLIHASDPDIVEEVKWRKPSNSMLGVPTWSHDGIICTGETYKDKVKLTFAKGASLKDKDKLFNSSLDGKTRRAIDIHEGEKVDARAFKALVRAAVDLNTTLGKGKPKRAK